MKTHTRTMTGALALAALLSPACYRATGHSRPPLIAEEIPAVGGDRVPGLKSAAGAGDYYIGNDFVGLALDGTPPHVGQGIAGAPGGGSIVDVGFVMLDNSFRRVAPPCDMLDRMTTVVNQDPGIQLVFHDFRTGAEDGLALLEMDGRLHDPGHRLPGASWDAEGFVLDVAASARISLGTMDRHFSLETTITNNAASDVGVRSIGDFVLQRGGGFRLLAPVWGDPSGGPLHDWGVDMPGTDFSDPLGNSVRAWMAVLMGTEPGSDTLDCHVSLGLLPMDADHFLLACDPQPSMAGAARPVFPERVVAGGLDSGSPLGPGESLSHSRRLYAHGGPSGALEYISAPYTGGTPNQGTGLLNGMYRDRAALSGGGVSTLFLLLEDTGARLTPVPSELRFELYTGPEGGDPATDADPLHWRLERLEWMEPADSTERVTDYYGNTTASTPNTQFGFLLPKGTYRIVSSNPWRRAVFQTGTNLLNQGRPSLATAIDLAEASAFYMQEPVCPEYYDTHSPQGSKTSTALSHFTIATRGNDSVVWFVQPMRFTLLGGGGQADPAMMRKRYITSTFDANIRGPRLPGPPYSPEIPPGSFHFMGGDTALGVQMSPDGSALTVSLSPGAYDAYGSRGPLSTLEEFNVDARPGLPSSRTLTVFDAGAPAGWLALDLPGPSMATAGGALPCELMASALAEGVQAVALAEMDMNRRPYDLYTEFKASLNYDTATNRSVGAYPLMVAGRSSDLGGFGTATALFTPADPGARLGGARPSAGWTLADFMAQSEGEYFIVNRPRGPRGLFRDFDPEKPLPQAAPWWDDEGPVSLGRTNGGFDAIEIMSAGTVAASGAAEWWSEFRKARGDWFSLISQQPHDSFTKAVGFSGGRFCLDTPVGLARTYLHVGEGRAGQSSEDAYMDRPGYDSAMGDILGALRSGAAVASTGPLLIARVKSGGGGGGDGGWALPGGLAVIGGSPATVDLDVTLVAPDWVPVDEIRVVVNRRVERTLPEPKVARPDNPLRRSDADPRVYAGTITVPVPARGDAWLVAEAGAPLDTSGAYRSDAVAWSRVMKGIYPAAVANPIFLDLDGGGYVPPGI